MGKLIVIEGTDGSGKSTQFRMLTEHLNADGTVFKHIVFPRYDQESSALIRMYLAGQFGTQFYGLERAKPACPGGAR